MMDIFRSVYARVSVCELWEWNVLGTDNREHTFVLIPKLDYKGTDLLLTWSL